MLIETNSTQICHCLKYATALTVLVYHSECDAQAGAAAAAATGRRLPVPTQGQRRQAE
jgi:hypothetical protein